MNELPLNIQELAEIARARAALFAFLNMHFMNLPDQNFVNHIRSDNFRSALEDLQSDADESNLKTGAGLMLNHVRASSELNVNDLSNELGVDRTRLYRGISPSYGPPPPYEAVWTKKSPSVTAVLQAIAGIYKEDGMAISPDAKDRLDYVGVELDYLYQLATREAASWDLGDEEKARQLLDRQNIFLHEHLGDWLPAFVDKALPMAQTDFYRGHLIMLRGLVAEEQERLHALVDEMRVTA